MPGQRRRRVARPSSELTIDGGRGAGGGAEAAAPGRKRRRWCASDGVAARSDADDGCGSGGAAARDMAGVVAEASGDGAEATALAAEASGDGAGGDGAAVEAAADGVEATALLWKRRRRSGSRRRCCANGGDGAREVGLGASLPRPCVRTRTPAPLQGAQRGRLGGWPSEQKPLMQRLVVSQQLAEAVVHFSWRPEQRPAHGRRADERATVRPVGLAVAIAALVARGCTTCRPPCRRRAPRSRAALPAARLLAPGGRSPGIGWGRCPGRHALHEHPVLDAADVHRGHSRASCR